MATKIKKAKNVNKAKVVVQSGHELSPKVSIVWVRAEDRLMQWPIFCAQYIQQALPLIAAYLALVPDDPELMQRIGNLENRRPWFAILAMDASAADVLASYTNMPKKLAYKMYTKYFRY